jgi:hypothetical protein
MMTNNVWWSNNELWVDFIAENLLTHEIIYRIYMQEYFFFKIICKNICISGIDGSIKEYGT